MAFAIGLVPAAAQVSHLSMPVKLWAICHPFAAMKVKKLEYQCRKTFDKTYLYARLDSFNAGGKLDAFRHVFNMAAYAQKISVRKIRKLGVAHEKGNYRQFRKRQLEEGERPDSLSCVMDLRNNELGLAIGCTHPRMELRELGELVIADIEQGKALILKRNAAGKYLRCDSRVIDMKKYTGSWSVPKCLVASDGNYPP